MLLLFENAKLAVEALILCGIVLLFWLHPAVRGTLRSPKVRPVAILLLLLFAVELLAQITTRNQYSYPQKHEPFPFTRWAMFSGFTKSIDKLQLYDWRGVRQDGSTVHLNPAHLFVTPNATVLFTKTQALGGQLVNDKAREHPEAEHALDAFSQGILNRYNHLNPTTPITRVELWQRVAPLKQGSATPALFTAPESEMIHFWNQPQTAS